MWIILISVCSVFILLATAMLCLCWRKKTEKNDLLGLDGLVTQKNPDENVNHLPSAQTVPDGITIVIDKIAADANKRPVIVNNPRRSLPDIPSDGVRGDGDIVTYEQNGDNSSDLYATVEPYQNTAKRHTLPNGINARPSLSQHSSISQADDTFSPYARVREHPYDKLLKAEHPYARVQSSNFQEVDENSSGEATPRNAALRSERTSTSQLIESAAPNSRRSSLQSGIVDIPAASAVSGGIAANQELPYMTPPIAQQNFSGDSQDSSKGYTSISVREPLANIRAQTKLLSHKVHGDLDPHYSTVSDDSDDMYTTIQDPNNVIYTSESETYAQIQPPPLLVAAEVNANVPSQDEENDVDSNEGVPQPPSVDSLKHVTHTHSRQASSSSSVGILSSPKPEKRKANSPLPPPPASASPIFDKPATCKNLDDMYAKVQKAKKRTEDECDVLLREQTKRYNEEQKHQSLPSCSINDHNYETLKKSPRKLVLDASTSEFFTMSGPDSLLTSDAGYEILKHSEVLSEIDPNYEELRDQNCNNANYSAVGNRLEPTDNQDNIDGYSVVNKQSKNSSSDELKSKTSSSYESTDEPNYESMPSESLSDHNYPGFKSTGSESDPNYESVNHNDPNYESVKYLDVAMDNMPYERLQEEDSTKSDSLKKDESDSDAGYEKVKTGNVKDCDNGDPGYETIKNASVQSQTDYEGVVQV